MKTSDSSTQKRTTVAVLGAGIMGSSVALFLARRGINVVLIDAAASAFSAASRWNEGKIHLGYLYAGDKSLATVKKLLPGGLEFLSLVEDLVGRDIRKTATETEDVYLVHRQSVVSADEAFAQANRIAAIIREHPRADRYFTPLNRNHPRPLSQAELESRYNTDELVFGYEVPERSVSTLQVADYFADAIAGTPGIETMWNHHVKEMRRNDGADERWSIETQTVDGLIEILGPFDTVVNALWEDRGRVDASLGIRHSDTWTHRYRVSLFARTSTPVSIRSAVISVGPFGDIKNYDGRNLYFSWYNTGLLAESTDLVHPPTPELSADQKDQLAEETFSHLGFLIPEVQSIRNKLASVDVRGGWVYAAGTGALDNHESGLHRRDNVGIVHEDGYFSIDTGKYSIAPYLARQVADIICGRT